MTQLNRVSKLLWIDTETTGLDAGKCAIWQLAGIVEVAGEVKEEFDIRICPFEGALVEEGALKLQDGAVSISDGMPEKQAHEQLTRVLNYFVNKFDRDDKFVLAGYNISFDDPFLRALFVRTGDKYFGSYFAWPKLDVQTLVALYYSEMSFRPPNFKLETIAPLFGIALDAHDALSDIRATRSLYQILRYTITPARTEAA